MKNIKNKLILFLLVLCYSSCEEAELETNPVRDDIFFHYSLTKSSSMDKGDIAPQSVVDSVVIRFGYDIVPKQDSVVAIRLRLLGGFSSEFRPVNFVLVDDDTSDRAAKLGEDIELLHDASGIWPDSRNGYVFVKLKNTEKLKTKSLRATIRTAPNEYFPAMYDKIEEEKKYNSDSLFKSNTYSIVFDAINDKPNLWAAYEDRFTKNVFGKYSLVKFNFICEVLHMDYAYFTYDPTTENPATIYNQRFKIADVNGWKVVLQLALEKYERENGVPLKDENGEVVVIGGFVPEKS